MKLAICTDVLANLGLEEMLDTVKAYGLDAVEMTAGGWGACTHVPTRQLLDDDEAFKKFCKAFADREMHIAALNCSGNQLCPGEVGDKYSSTAYECAELAGKLGVKKIVMMSGLPAGSPEDKIPNWITTSVTVPFFMPDVLAYQWEVTIAWWKNFVEHCKKHGITQIAIEEFPGMMVYSPDTLWKLREAVDPMVGLNLDPSHLFIMGADPIASARALKGAIYHIHGKDARVERTLVEVNGLPEYRPVDDVENRTWNYVAVGCGHDLQWWKELFSVCHMLGYDDYVSLEMEDLTMSVEAGITTSIAALKASISV